MLCYWRRHLVQFAAGMNLYLPQLHHPIHSSLSDEVCWWRWKSENVDCRKESVQRSRELFYWFPPLSDSLEVDEDPHLEEPDSGNKADLKPEKDECLWKINLLVTSIDKLNFDTTVNVEGEWFINENFRFGLLLCICLDSVSLVTSTNVDSDLWSVMNALT